MHYRCTIPVVEIKIIEEHFISIMPDAAPVSKEGIPSSDIIMTRLHPFKKPLIRFYTTPV